MRDRERRAKILALVRKIQDGPTKNQSGPNKIVTDEGLATEIVRREPSLKPREMQWAAWVRLVREILKDHGIFSGDVASGSGAALSLLDIAIAHNPPEQRVEQAVRELEAAVARRPLRDSDSMMFSMEPAGPSVPMDEGRRLQAVAEMRRHVREIPPDDGDERNDDLTPEQFQTEVASLVEQGTARLQSGYGGGRLREIIGRALGMLTGTGPIVGQHLADGYAEQPKLRRERREFLAELREAVTTTR
jgi:hypothetical protein